MQAAALFTAHDVYRFAVACDFAQRVFVGVVHRRCRGHRAGVEGLHLVGSKAAFLQPDRQVHHVVVTGARVGRDEIRDQKLLFARFQRVLFKHLLELVIAADAGLHHFGEWALLGVLRRNLQVAAHVVRHQLFDVLRALHRQVIAQAGADQNFLHALQRPRAAVHLDERVVVGVQVRANARVHTRRFAAGRFDLGAFAADAVHVGRRAAEVGNGAGKAFDRVADRLDLSDHRVLGPALDDAAFVLSDGAERAAAKATPHDVHAEADHFPGRDFGRMVVAAVLVGIAGVWGSGVRQVEHVVHLSRGQRDRWRGDPHVAGRWAFTVRLDQRTGVAGVGFQVQHAVGMGVQHGVAFDLLVRRQANH